MTTLINTLFVIAFILAAVFLILLTRAVITVVKDSRREKRNARIIKENEDEIAFAKTQGKKPFYFENKKFLVLARSRREATVEYQMIRKSTNLKKA
jgi:predicted membrane protein